MVQELPHAVLFFCGCFRGDCNFEAGCSDQLIEHRFPQVSPALPRQALVRLNKLHADDRDPGTHRRVYLQDAPGPKQDLGSEENDEDVTVPNMAKKLVKILKIIKILLRALSSPVWNAPSMSES